MSTWLWMAGASLLVVVVGVGVLASVVIRLALGLRHMGDDEPKSP